MTLKLNQLFISGYGSGTAEGVHGFMNLVSYVIKS